MLFLTFLQLPFCAILDTTCLFLIRSLYMQKVFLLSILVILCFSGCSKPPNDVTDETLQSIKLKDPEQLEKERELRQKNIELERQKREIEDLKRQQRYDEQYKNLN